jgi:Holliday junction resolvase-like predicted endonuclease
MSTEIGGRAEVAAARHLQGLGMKILARNYRDRW